MATNPMNTRLLGKFREHLRFVERSCELFDKGEEEESFRIAVSLRVIFHQTTASKSLVTHLGFEKKRMLSSARGHGDWKDYLSVQLNINSTEPLRMLPILGDQFTEVSIDDWWKKETVFVHHDQNQKKKCSRRDVVLDAANKDGGAHVDERLTKYYEILSDGSTTLGITGNLTFNGTPPFPQGVTIYPRNAHLALIRQFAHEFRVSVAHFAWLGK